jgi:hypothetical protein
MSTSESLLPSLQADINQARANIPLAHRERPEGDVSSPESAFIHINDWAFLNSYTYVTLSGSAKHLQHLYQIDQVKSEDQPQNKPLKIDV